MAVIAAIAATSYATPSVQASNGRARLEQARREADHAEANARQLRSQADEAEQEAQQSQGKVRTVSEQVAQADSTYSAQVRRQSNTAGSQRIQHLQNPVTPVASKTPSFTDLASRVVTTPWSNVNQRSTSGRLVNVTA